MGNELGRVISFTGPDNQTRQIKVESQLAEGGFSRVFLCRDINSNVKYALKEMVSHDKESKQVILKEIRFLTRFGKCSHITSFYGAVSRKPDNSSASTRPGTQFYVLMEKCEDSLIKVVHSQQDSGKPFSEGRVMQMLREIATGLLHMHSATPPIAHRDLKLDNVLVGANGELQVCDFGSVTTMASTYENKTERNDAEEVINKYSTFLYRAPEMLNLYSKDMVNEKVDIWALGCIFFTLCYFVHPFQDASSLAILSGNYTIPTNQIYSDFVVNVIKRLLTIKPKKRPSIKEVLEYCDIHEKWLKQGKQQPCPAVPAYQSDKKKKKKHRSKKKNTPPPPSSSSSEHKQQQQEQQQQQQSFDSDFDDDFSNFPNNNNNNPSSSSSVQQQQQHKQPPPPPAKKPAPVAPVEEFGSFTSALPSPVPPVVNTAWKCHICRSDNAGSNTSCAACFHGVCDICRGGLNPQRAVVNPNVARRQQQKDKKQKKKKKKTKNNESVDWSDNPFGNTVDDPFASAPVDQFDNNNNNDNNNNSISERDIDPFAAAPANNNNDNAQNNDNDASSSSSGSDSDSDSSQSDEEESASREAVAEIEEEEEGKEGNHSAASPWACHKCKMDLPSSVELCSLCKHKRCDLCGVAEHEGEVSEEEEEQNNDAFDPFA